MLVLIVYCVCSYQPSPVCLPLDVCIGWRSSERSHSFTNKSWNTDSDTVHITAHPGQAHACSAEKLLQLVESKPVCCSFFGR